MEIHIRHSRATDLPEITEIYNQAIRRKICIAYLQEFTVEERKAWYQKHSSNSYPLLIAEENNRVLGWISLSPYREGREALKATVLVSYFVHDEHQGKGIGSALLKEMLVEAKNLSYRTILAIIFEENIVSKRILEKAGFEQWGYLPEVARIDDAVFSHAYYGKKLF